jgi:hypothetical protein
MACGLAFVIGVSWRTRAGIMSSVINAVVKPSGSTGSLSFGQLRGQAANPTAGVWQSKRSAPSARSRLRVVGHCGALQLTLFVQRELREESAAQLLLLVSISFESLQREVATRRNDTNETTQTKRHQNIRILAGARSTRTHH